MISPDRARVHYKIPKAEEQATRGLTRNARGHVAEIGGYVFRTPEVRKLHNVHGEEAEELVKKLWEEGKFADIITGTREYCMYKPELKSERRLDPYEYRFHSH